MTQVPKRGRPTVDGVSVGKSPVVAVRLPPSDFARLQARTTQDRESIQDAIRRVVRRELDAPRQP